MLICFTFPTLVWSTGTLDLEIIILTPPRLKSKHLKVCFTLKYIFIDSNIKVLQS
jgi:hypothetical protein